MLPCFYFDLESCRMPDAGGRGRLPGCRFWTGRIRPVHFGSPHVFFLLVLPTDGRLGLEDFLTHGSIRNLFSACRYLAQRPYQTKQQHHSISLDRDDSRHVDALRGGARCLYTWWSCAHVAGRTIAWSSSLLPPWRTSLPTRPTIPEFAPTGILPMGPVPRTLTDPPTPLRLPRALRCAIGVETTLRSRWWHQARWVGRAVVRTPCPRQPALKRTFADFRCSYLVLVSWTVEPFCAVRAPRSLSGLLLCKDVGSLVRQALWLKACCPPLRP